MSKTKKQVTDVFINHPWYLTRVRNKNKKIWYELSVNKWDCKAYDMLNGTSKLGEIFEFFSFNDKSPLFKNNVTVKKYWKREEAIAAYTYALLKWG